MKQIQNTSLKQFTIQDVPEDCTKIILQQNNTKIVIHKTIQHVENRTTLLLAKIKQFFAITQHWNDIAPLLQQRSTVSLRLLDWLVTNYSKKHTVILTTHRNDTPEQINLFLDYKAQLKAYSKKYFDPFCRRERMLISFDADSQKHNYITTIAQLTFFRWTVQLRLIQYCEQHYQQIEQDMVKNLRVKTKNTQRRKQISKSATASLNRTQIQTHLGIQ